MNKAQSVDSLNQENQSNNISKIERRKLLKLLAASGGAIAVSTMLPTEWIEPVVEAGVLPAHAQISTAGGAAGPIVPAPCGQQFVSGGNTPDTQIIDLGKSCGTFQFDYETYFVPDQIIVTYEGNPLLITTCAGENRSVMLNYCGNSTQITVEVIPNCSGTSGTAWNYTVHCPA